MTIASLSRLSSFPVRSARPWDPWRSGEPTLAEVMEDPIVHLLMRRDGLTPAAVWPLLDRIGASLAGPSDQRSAA